MSQQRSYRIVFRRHTPADAGHAPGFTVVVPATDEQNAMAEAERLSQTLKHQFELVEIIPVQGEPERDPPASPVLPV